MRIFVILKENRIGKIGEGVSKKTRVVEEEQLFDREETFDPGN